MKKNSMFIIISILMLSSCAKIREWRAQNNQPYKPHQDQKMKQKHHR
jgi:hypothetical protein